MTLECGSTLNNRYRIVDILGQGGMAAIYRAVDLNLGVEVAVKENLFTTEEYARQFRREAEILASLRHPNLPRVTDHFVIEGQGQYLVMDYIEGEDLRQRIDRSGVLSDDEAIVVGVAICDALIYLHSRRPCVLHRDIKPGNVKVTPTGQVYLVDFGLAKVVLGRDATEEGARAMTPGYSPPEQYGTAHTDHRSDIYSLAATLYSALTDNLPEDGLARAMDQAKLTPVRKHNPRVSKKLEQVLEKALAVLPEARYSTAEEFRLDLLNARAASRKRDPIDLTLSPPPEHLELDQAELEAHILNDGSPDTNYLLPISQPVNVSSRPASHPQKKPRRSIGCLSWGGFLAILITLGVAVGGIFLFTPELPGAFLARIFSPEGIAGILPLPTETSAPSPFETSQPVTFLPEPTATPTLEPETKPTATAAVESEIESTSTPSISPTPFGGGASLIAFASDRSGIPQIYIRSLDGGTARQVTDIREGACQPAWSPDGTQLVFVSPCKKEQESYANSSLFLINADGTELSVLSDIPAGDYDPSWSPDGKLIAFTSLRDDRRPKIFTIDVLTRRLRLLANEGPVNMQPAWSPDGSQIAFVTNRKGPYQIWIMKTDGSDQQLFSRNWDWKNTLPAWSPNGKLILFTQVRSEGMLPTLMHVEIGATQTEGIQLYDDAVIPMRQPSFTPDGRWVAFETWKEGENHDIAIIRVNGIDFRLLIDDPGYDFDPAIQP